MTFEQIYKATFQYVYRFFYYKSVNKADIEDLSHEVFIRFYKKFDNRQLDEAEAKRILFGFCTNVYKEWVRKCIKENKSDFNDNFEYEDLVDNFVDEGFEKKLEERKKNVREGIAKLNDKMKYIIEARFLHGKTRKEVADELGMKEKDVHTYQKRGVKYLKKIINNED